MTETKGGRFPTGCWEEGIGLLLKISERQTGESKAGDPAPSSGATTAAASGDAAVRQPGKKEFIFCRIPWSTLSSSTSGDSCISAVSTAGSDAAGELPEDW